MTDLILESFIACENSLVVAPAGYGKTDLLFRATKKLSGRQLLLTHTQAGVYELLKRLRESDVATEKYEVRTIDSFASMLVRSYPGISDHVLDDKAGDWLEVKKSFLRILDNSIIRRSLKCSYSGILVDEYQDCSEIQHTIIKVISEFLPCRVTGDPLQGIFDFGEGLEKMVPWQDVEDHFDKIGTLTVPYRWKKTNPALGQWIVEVRSSLLLGDEIGFDGLRKIGVYFVKKEPGKNTQTLLKLANKKERQVVGIFQSSRDRCHSILSRLKNIYSVYEDADARELQEIVSVFDDPEGQNKFNCIVRVILEYTAKKPTDFKKWVRIIEEGGTPFPRRSDFSSLVVQMKNLFDSPTESGCLAVMKAFESLEKKPTFLSYEYWELLKRGLDMSMSDSDKTLSECIFTLRQRAKIIGRRVPMKCISTTLLLKGLEFRDVVVLDASEYRDARKFYVAISRATERLIIIGDVSKIQFPSPNFS